MESIASTFDNFKEKFTRFKESGNDFNASAVKSKKSALKERISFDDKERVRNIILKYRQFENPVSKETEDDEEALLKAWELFFKVSEFNEANSSEDTFIEKIKISSPLVKKTDYTDGAGFSYLQAWFILNYGDKAKLYVPEIVLSGGSYELIFTAGDVFKASPLLKEILLCAKQVV